MCLRESSLLILVLRCHRKCIQYAGNKTKHPHAHRDPFFPIFLSRWLRTRSLKGLTTAEATLTHMRLKKTKLIFFLLAAVCLQPRHCIRCSANPATPFPAYHVCAGLHRVIEQRGKSSSTVLFPLHRCIRCTLGCTQKKKKDQLYSKNSGRVKPDVYFSLFPLCT